ncbi:beta-N-acetylglucosaminidase [Puteibacter caeruleilacunae]|nr:beta-N-acetylglucosaminidase [Puteibacter caeruleilacunae]
MKRIIKISICLLMLSLPIIGFAQNQLSIIPKPVETKIHKSSFLLNDDTQLKASPGLQNEADYLADLLNISTGIELKNGSLAKSNTIELRVDGSLLKKHGEDAYKLTVERNRIVISGASSVGVFNGIQTLMQIMPPSVFSRVNLGINEVSVPCVEVLDYPRFSWRGFMLDSSRSFQSVEYVKKTLDLMAMHKMNVFHWHLTDDHGWRVEIKKYPWLTEKGAWRKQPNYPVKGEMESYGGYYTQKQIREIVKYATERHITIIPEVDLPGHSSALLWAMPELACDSVEQQTHMQYFYDFPIRGVDYIRHNGTNVICAGKESVYPVIEDILDEIIALFPSEYIHVGGDEVNKKWWSACPHCQARAKKEGLKDMDELQAYFINRVEKMVNARNRKLIGWDEIMDGGLSKSASVMAWRNIDGAKRAINLGHKTVVAAHQGYYIQENQTKNPFHPQGWPRINTAQEVYEFNPIPEGISTKQQELILGIQTSVWTPFMHNDDLLDIALYPRNCALSEAAWTQESLKEWSNFEERLNKHLPRLDYQGVAYWREESIAIGKWDTQQLWDRASVLEYDVTKDIDRAGVYFLLGDLKEGKELVIEEASIFENGKLLSRDKHTGYISRERNHDRIYFLDVQRVNKDAQYTVQLKVRGTLGKVSKGNVFLLQADTGSN